MREPVHVRGDGWLLHYSPARGRGRVVLKEWDAGRWRVVGKWRGELPAMWRRFREELERRVSTPGG